MRGCAAAGGDVLVCLAPGCSFVGCGGGETPGSKHAFHHASSMSHPVLVSARTGLVHCAACARIVAPGGHECRPELNVSGGRAGAARGGGTAASGVLTCRTPCLVPPPAFICVPARSPVLCACV